MKRHIGHTGSCSCTNCVYKSRSQLPSVQHLIETGGKIDRLYYGKYLPLRESKLLSKLIRTRAVYDDVRTQLLSASGSSDQTKDTQDDSTERSSAVTKIVDLVDRGQVGSSGGSKLSSCCSCCSCSSMKKIRVEKHPRVHRHSVPYEAIERYNLEAKRKGVARRNRLSTKISSKLRAVRFKAKRVRSAPCACTLDISSIFKRLSKPQLKRKRSKEMSTITTETQPLHEQKTPAKSVKIDRKALKLKCLCNFKFGKHPLKSFHKLKRSKTSSISGESEVTTGKRFRIRKDSLMMFRDKLKRKEVLQEGECEPGICEPDECIPEDCYKKIKARSVGRRKKKKYPNKSSGTDISRSHVSISTKKRVSNANVGRRVKNIDTTSGTTSEGEREIHFQKEEPSVIGENVQLQTKRDIRKSKSHATKPTKKQSKVQMAALCYCPPANSQEGSQLNQSASITSKSTYIKSKLTRKSVSHAKKSPKKLSKIQPPTTSQEGIQLNESSSQTSKPTNHKSKLMQKSISNAKKQSKKKDAIETAASCDCPPNRRSLTAKPTYNKNIPRQQQSKPTNWKSEINEEPQSSPEELESHPSRQAVRIGSTFSFNIEFYKDKPSDNNGPGAHVSEELYESKPEITNGTGRRIKNRHRSSQSISSVSKKNAQTGHGLKRCICTLKIPKRKQQPYIPTYKKTMTSLNIRKVDVVGRMRETQTKPFKNQGAKAVYVTPPLTSKPRPLLPYECDPFECEKRIKVRNRNRSKYLSKDINTLRKTFGTEKSQLSLSRSNRQGVRIGSSFSFNIEFSKENISIEPENNEIERTTKKKPRIEKKQYRNKGIKIHKPKLRNTTSQTKKTEKSIHTHTTKGVDECICPANILKEQSTVTPIEHTQDSSVIMTHKSIATEKENRKHRNQATLLPYECERGVCTPDECDPYECEKRIIMRHAKTVTSSTTKMATTHMKRSKMDIREPRGARKIERDIITTPSQSGKQVVRIGSSFSFNVEFYKERLPADELKSIKVIHDKKDKTRQHSMKTAKLKEVGIQDSKRREHHVSSNTETRVNKKGISVSSAAKRCFCTLKFHKKDKLSKINRERNEHTSSPKHRSKGIRNISNTDNSAKIILKPKYCRAALCDHHECCKETKHRHPNRTNSKIIQRRHAERNPQISVTKRRNVISEDKSKKVETKKETKDVKIEKPPVIQVKKERKALNLGLRIKNAMGLCKRRLGAILITIKKIKIRRSVSQYTMVKVKKPKHGENKPVTAAFFQVIRDVDYKAMKSNLHKYDQYESKYLKVGAEQEIRSRVIKCRSITKFSEEYSRTEVLSNYSLFKESYQNWELPQGHRDNTFPDNYIRNSLSKQCIRYSSSIGFNIKSTVDTLKIKSSELHQNRYDQHKNFNVTSAMKRPFQHSYYALNVKIPNTFPKKRQTKTRTLEQFECEPNFCVPGECNPIECLKRINSRFKSSKSSGTDHLKNKTVTNSTQGKFSTKSRTAQSYKSAKPKKSWTKGSRKIYERPTSNEIRGSSRQSLSIGSNFSFKAEFYKHRTPVQSNAAHKSKSTKSVGSKTRSNNFTTGVHAMKKGYQSAKSQKSVSNENKGIGPVLKRCFCTLKLQKTTKTVRELKNTIKETKCKQTMANEPFGNICLYQNQMVMTNKLKPYECAPGICIPGECDPNECYKLIQRRLNKNRDQSVGTGSVKIKSGQTKFEKKHKAKNTQSIAQTTSSRKDNKHVNRTGHGNNKVLPKYRQAVRFGSDITFNVEFYKDNSSGDATHFKRSGKNNTVTSISTKQMRDKSQGQAKSRSYNKVNAASPKTQDAKGGTSLLERCFCTLKLKKTTSKEHNITSEIHKNKDRVSFTNDKFYTCDKNSCPDSKVATKSSSKFITSIYACDETTCSNNNVNKHEKYIKSRRTRSKNTKVHKGKHEMSVKSDISKKGTAKTAKHLTKSFQCEMQMCNNIKKSRDTMIKRCVCALKNQYIHDRNNLTQKESKVNVLKKHKSHKSKLKNQVHNNIDPNSPTGIETIMPPTKKSLQKRGIKIKRKIAADHDKNDHQSEKPCVCMTKRNKGFTHVNKYIKQAGEDPSALVKNTKQLKGKREFTDLKKPMITERQKILCPTCKYHKNLVKIFNVEKQPQRFPPGNNDMKINEIFKSVDKHKITKAPKNVKQSKPPKARATLVKTERNGYSFEIHGKNCQCRHCVEGENNVNNHAKKRESKKTYVKPQTNTSYHGLYPCLCSDKDINKKPSTSRSNKNENVKMDDGLCPMCKHCKDEEPICASLLVTARSLMERVNKIVAITKSKHKEPMQESPPPKIPLFEMVVNNTDMSIVNKEHFIDKVKHSSGDDRYKTPPMSPSFEMAINRNDASIMNTNEIRKKILDKAVSPNVKPQTNTSYHGLYPCLCSDKKINKNPLTSPSNKNEKLKKDDGLCPMCKHCKDKEPICASLLVTARSLMERVNKIVAITRSKHKEPMQESPPPNIPLLEMVVNNIDMSIVNKEQFIDKVKHSSGDDRGKTPPMSPSFQMAINRSDASIMNTDEIRKKIMASAKTGKIPRSKSTKSKSLKYEMPKKPSVKGTKSERQAYSFQIHGKKCKCCYCANKGRRKSDSQPATGFSKNKAFMDVKPIGDGNKTTKRGPCICGSVECKREVNQEKQNKLEEKRAKQKPCVCGSKICGDESKILPKSAVVKGKPKNKKNGKQKEKEKPKSQKPDFTAIGELVCGKISFQEFKNRIMGKIQKRDKKSEQIKSKKSINAAEEQEKRKKLYAKEDAIRRKARIKSDKLAMKDVERYKDTPDSLLCVESFLDMGKLGGHMISGVLRSGYRAIRDPISSVLSIKELSQDPERAFRLATESVAGSGVAGTVTRIKRRIGAMSRTQECIAKMESNQVTNYMVHFADKDPKKRLAKQGKRVREPVDFECSLFMGSLRKKPHLWVYYMCPWFYPHCISLIGACRQFTDVLMFLLAVAVWSPCIFAMEACRALMCCFLCTG